MGTLHFADFALPDADSEEGEREVTICRPSGEEYLTLRIGEIGERHMPTEYAVKLDEEGARMVLGALLASMRYLGFDTEV